MNGLMIGTYAFFLFVGAIGGLAFPIIYTITSRWWKDEVGINLFLFSGLFALLYMRGAFQFFDPVAQQALRAQSPNNAIFILSITVLASFVVWQRIWVFFHTRRDKKKGARDGVDE